MKYKTIGFFLFGLIANITLFSQAKHVSPNIILVFIDDMGYGDVGFNNPAIKHTPNLDYLASKGVQLTNFYVSQAVCTASRASLLTGCYANRIGMGGALDHRSVVGLHPGETTIAEILKTKGYSTAGFGKWHLGLQPTFLPSKQGFDQFYGIPYSGDMWPKHPDNPNYYPVLPVYQDNEIIDTVEEQSWFTSGFTKKAIDYISAHIEQPFFLYLAHPLPHVPLFVSETFKGSTGKGLYADVIHEIDASVGAILQSLRDNGLEENTLLIVTSDNGPWLSYGNHSGITAGLREGKGTAWEGGVRTPFVAYWKSVLPEGKKVNDPIMTIDILPTIARLTGASLPDRKIDGINVWERMMGTKKSIPDRPLFFYYNKNDLEAMRWKQWKLYFPHSYRTMAGQAAGLDGQPGKYRMVKMEAMELYDLSKDPFETKNVIATNKKLQKKLEVMAAAIRVEIGDNLQNIAGKENRPAGRIN